MGLIFESFLIFYMLEILVLALAYCLYFKKPKVLEKKIYNPWGFWD